MSEHYQVAIIGSGPGGLGAATNAAQHGLSHILFEKSEIANTIYEYQLRKHVMAEPGKLPLRACVDFQPGTREGILASWNHSLKDLAVNVRKGEVTAIKKEGELFHISCSAGDVTATNVVLAIGCQGTPRKPGVPGEDLPHVSYTLSDPDAYQDEDILVVGVGDAAIENALALADKNRVTILNREDTFPRAKEANAAALTRAIQERKIEHVIWSNLNRIQEGVTYVDGPEGEIAIKASRVIVRIGAVLPRRFVEGCGIEFPSSDLNAVPVVSERYESNVSGLFVVGALIGYPLIKQAMNQGHEVIEHIIGNPVIPADQVLVDETLAVLSGSSQENLKMIRDSIPLLQLLSEPQFRECIIDSTLHCPKEGDVLFQKNDYTDSFWCVVKGSAYIELGEGHIIEVPPGQFFGEMGLLSGRRRSATVRAGKDAIFLETPRNQMLKLNNSVEEVKRLLDERFIRNVLESSIFPDIEPEFLKKLVKRAGMKTFKKGETLAREGEFGDCLFVIRKGSVKISRLNARGEDVAFTYLSAGHYVGEMSLMSDTPMPRTATVTAAVPCETIIIEKDAFRELLKDNAEVRERVVRLSHERHVQNLTNTQDSEAGKLLDFVVSQGVTDAENVLLIDSDLCIGCDNCESACAATHSGYSRLDRKGGKNYDSLQIPVSCRHCENPLCMIDCPPDALIRMSDGEVVIQDSCIGCGNCVRNCPYGVIQMVYDRPAPKSRGFFSWLFTSSKDVASDGGGVASGGGAKAGKCDMCRSLEGGPACVRACPTGAAMRVNPSTMLHILSDKRSLS
ncbi:MAG: cyclic nucleotide-binding domain-containing protein [Bdellovibrionota bacterium]